MDSWFSQLTQAVISTLQAETLILQDKNRRNEHCFAFIDKLYHFEETRDVAVLFCATSNTVTGTELEVQS